MQLNQQIHLENDHVVFSRNINIHCSSPCVHNGVVSVISPLNFSFWQRELQDHPDPGFVSQVMDYMCHGAPTGYTGPHVSMENPNWPSVRQFSHEVRQNTLTDLDLHRIVGPFHQKPFDNIICSPLGAFQKKRSTKVRTIHDLSYPASRSINDFIDKDENSLTFETVENAVQLCQQIRTKHKCQVVYGAKLDLKDAFKHIVVRPDEWHLLGSTWQEKSDKEYWFSTVLPFGMRSSPKIFEQFSLALQFFMEKHGATNIVRIMDDFGTFSFSEEDCNRNLQIMLDVCKMAGFDVQVTKVVWATPILEFLGIIIDNLKQELRISVERLLEISSLLKEWENRTFCSKRQLLSLIGKLTFCSKVIKCGKTFTRRLIELSKKAQYLHQKLYISKYAQMDIAWWSSSLEKCNGVCMFPTEWISDEVLHMFTDASDQAIAATFGNEWFYRCFVGRYAHFRQKSITYRELLALVVAVATFGRYLVGKRVIFHIDNIACVYIVNSVYSKCEEMMVLVRRLYWLLSEYQMECHAVYINTKLNHCADSLSRLDMDRFRYYSPESEPCMTWPEPLELEGIIY